LTITQSTEQLKLVFNHSSDSLRRYVEEHVKRRVSLLLTNNSTTMLSARVHNNVLHLRLHRIFLNADSTVVDEIVSYLKNRKSKMPGFRMFIREHMKHFREKQPNKIAIRTAGTFYDLRELYGEINARYFDNTIHAEITWGARCPRSAVRKRTLGSYSERSNIIRINPLLDRRSVPRYYIAYIVYHEMLHAAMGSPLKGKRRSIHSREFKARECLYDDYQIASAWKINSRG